MLRHIIQLFGVLNSSLRHFKDTYYVVLHVRVFMIIDIENPN